MKVSRLAIVLTVLAYLLSLAAFRICRMKWRSIGMHQGKPMASATNGLARFSHPY